jgi:uroporphyrin-III C-methyltransferase / precorrin-2 dehydrogenase / sirohydrochlorin ferrochelatase
MTAPLHGPRAFFQHFVERGDREDAMHSLPLFMRLASRPVILLGDGEAAQAKRQLLERAQAEIVGEDAVAALAIVAIEDEAEAQAAIARLKARGILVNAVDRPADCDFTLPAIIDRDPVLIAIGTGGASAGLAKALRQRLEPLLPQSLGTLAEALREGRASIRQRWPEARARRTAIDAALDKDGPLDLFKRFSSALFEAWLEAPDDPVESGLRRFTLQTDDPDGLTLEQARLLGQADLIVHSPLIAPEILARGRADAVRIGADSPPDPLPSGLTVHLVRGFGL